MNEPINIISEDSTIDLYVGTFHIYVLGGWDVDRGNFKITLTHSDTGKVITPYRPFMMVQDYINGELAKKIMIADIPKMGNYKIVFQNQNDLKVWNTKMLFLTRLYNQPIEKQYLQIVFK